MPLATVIVIGCCAKAIWALAPGAAGLAATIVAPVRASVTVSAAADAVSTSLGRVGLAFLCDSPAEVDRVHAGLVQAGYQSIHEPFDAFWGQRYATVRDPDGNAVDLFAATD